MKELFKKLFSKKFIWIPITSFVLIATIIATIIFVPWGPAEIIRIKRVKKVINNNTSISEDSNENKQENLNNNNNYDNSYIDDSNSNISSLCTGYGTTAYAILGEDAKYNHMSVKEDETATCTPSIRGGKNSMQITGNGDPSIWMKLSNVFIKEAGDKDLIVSVEFFGDKESTFEVKYANNTPATITETIITENKEDWITKNVRLTDVKYGGASSKDFTIHIDGNLRIASITVRAVEKATYVEAGAVTASKSNAFIGTQSVKTKYNTNETVMADVSVTFFGAVGDGVVDDSAAFLSAIDYVESLGGGTIFVPAGKYLVSKSLDIPSTVTLRGDTPENNGKKKVAGTVLYCKYGKGEKDFYAKGFINLDFDSGLRNIAIYYPEQTLKNGNATPFAWTVTMATGSTVEDVTLVNSFRGIRVGPQAHLLTTVRNLYATALDLGVFVGSSVDIDRFQNLNFYDDVWMNSGFAIPKASTLSNWLINNATAFLYERVDWTYFWDFTIEGYKIGMHGRKTTMESTESGAAGGQIYNANIKNCNTCLWVEDVTGMGGHLTNSHLSATGGKKPVAIKLGERFSSSFSFNGCKFETSGDNAFVNNGTGTVSIVNCDFKGKNSETLLNVSGSGDLSCTNSKFSGAATHVKVSSNVKNAELINNMTDKTLKISGNNIKKIYDNLEAPVITDSSTVYDVTYDTKPDKLQSINASKAPYNILSYPDGSGRDVSVLLQNALNDMKAAGGGVVYLSAGNFRLDNPITIPSGVELRGCSDVMLHNASNKVGTNIYTNYGKGKESGEALITLEENSGVYGFRVYHDQQRIRNISKYPYVIRAKGSDCYAVNIMLVNAYNGIDFASYKCDRHFISGIYGTQLKLAIRVGGGSENGVMRDCHFNPNSWLSGSLVHPTESGLSYSDRMDMLWPKQLGGADAFIVENVKNEILYTNFVYSAWRGFILRNGADAYMMGNAVDGAAMALQIEDVTTDKPLWIIAGQLCVAGGVNNECYIKTDSNFAGEVNIIQTLAFGAPPTAITLYGNGTARLIQTNITSIWTDTTTMATVNIKNSQFIGGFFGYQPPTYDIIVNNSINKTLIYGNIFRYNKNPNILNHAGSKATGTDIGK